MRILELYLKSFGKFSETHLFLSPGLQVFYGENEYGKSTIAAFIKAMLFGMERGRGRAAGKDVFSRYEPWGSPGNYAGVIRFTCGGRTFRLERRFDKYTKGASLVCEDDGEQLSLEDGDLDVLLGGMTSQSFENTAWIGALTARPGESLGQELKNFAANYYKTGGTEVDLPKAFAYLKGRQKALEQEMKEWKTEKQASLSALQVQIQYIEEEIKKLQNRKETISLTLKNTKNVEETEKQEKKYIKNKRNKNINRWHGKRGLATGAFFLGLGVLAGVGFLLLRPSLLWLSLFLILPGLFFLFHWRKGLGIGEEEGRAEESDAFQDAQEKRQQTAWELNRLEEEVREKAMQRGNLLEALREAEVPDEKYFLIQNRLDGVKLAQEKLKEAGAEISRSFGMRIKTAASGILEEITEGRYTHLEMDDGMNLSVYGEDRRIPAERLSRGTAEQVYFALRMAALDLMYQEEPMPVILDDTFSCYDDKRLKTVLKWLSRRREQVIIFSCQKREEEIVKEEGL